MSTSIVAMSRGLVVLDENVLSLESELRKLNIRVVKPVVGMDDEHIAEALASHRILITNDVDDFEQLAVEFEFGIVAVPEIGTNSKEWASKISAGLRKHSLWAEKRPFIYNVNSDQIRLLSG